LIRRPLRSRPIIVGAPGRRGVAGPTYRLRIPSSRLGPPSCRRSKEPPNLRAGPGRPLPHDPCPTNGLLTGKLKPEPPSQPSTPDGASHDILAPAPHPVPVIRPTH